MSPLAPALASLLALASAARAESPPVAAAASTEPKAKATAFALSHPDVPEARMVEVMRAVESGLRANPRLEMKDLDARLADFAQEAPEAELEAARAAYRDGQKALLELRIPDAVDRLEAAVSGLSKLLPYIKKQELADAMALLAVAQFEGGDRKAGHDQFVELLTWRPDYVYDPQLLPPQHVPRFEEAQREVERARRGRLAIASVPDGAQAYVDGRYVGVTPTRSDDLPVGAHFVTLKKDGFRKAMARATVVKRGETPVQVTLERSEKFLLVDQAREKIEEALAKDAKVLEGPAGAAADDLHQVLFVDHAVFVKVAQAGGGRFDVDAWLYDLRTRRRLAKAHRQVPAEGAEAALAPLAAALYVGVSTSPDLPVPVDAPPPRRESRAPFWRTWWFWTAGGVVVLGAVGAGVAVAETRPPGCPDGSLCFRVAP